MNTFILKVHDCNERTLDVVFTILMKKNINIKTFQILGGGFMNGPIVGYFQCEKDYDYSFLKELELEFSEYIPSYEISRLKQYEGTKKYEKKRRDFMSPIRVSTIPDSMSIFREMHKIG